MATYDTPMAMPQQIWDALWKDDQTLFEMMGRWNYASIGDSGENAEPDAMAVAHNDLNHALTRALIELFGETIVGTITTHMYDHDSLADAVESVLKRMADEVTCRIADVNEAHDLWWKVYEKTGRSDAETALLNEYKEMRANLWDDVFGTNIPSVDTDTEETWQKYRESIDRIVK